MDCKLCTTCGSSTGEKQKTFRLFNMVILLFNVCDSSVTKGPVNAEPFFKDWFVFSGGCGLSSPSIAHNSFLRAMKYCCYGGKENE